MLTGEIRLPCSMLSAKTESVSVYRGPIAQSTSPFCCIAHSISYKSLSHPAFVPGSISSWNSSYNTNNHGSANPLGQLRTMATSGPEDKEGCLSSLHTGSRTLPSHLQKNLLSPRSEVVCTGRDFLPRHHMGRPCLIPVGWSGAPGGLDHKHTPSNNAIFGKHGPERHLD